MIVPELCMAHLTGADMTLIFSALWANLIASVI